MMHVNRLLFPPALPGLARRHQAADLFQLAGRAPSLALGDDPSQRSVGHTGVQPQALADLAPADSLQAHLQDRLQGSVGLDGGEEGLGDLPKTEVLGVQVQNLLARSKYSASRVAMRTVPVRCSVSVTRAAGTSSPADLLGR